MRPPASGAFGQSRFASDWQAALICWVFSLTRNACAWSFTWHAESDCPHCPGNILCGDRVRAGCLGTASQAPTGSSAPTHGERAAPVRSEEEERVWGLGKTHEATCWGRRRWVAWQRE